MIFKNFHFKSTKKKLLLIKAMITMNSIYSLLALSSLSIIYFIRDIYVFNRAPNKFCRFTSVQWKVIILYPFWTFLEWVGGIQTKNKDILPLMFTTFAKHGVGFYTTVSILNDNFKITKQQFGGYFISLLIAYMWSIFWLFVLDE